MGTEENHTQFYFRIPQVADDDMDSYRIVTDGDRIHIIDDLRRFVGVNYQDWIRNGMLSWSRMCGEDSSEKNMDETDRGGSRRKDPNRRRRRRKKEEEDDLSSPELDRFLDEITAGGDRR